jgi:hypothetical protein
VSARAGASRGKLGFRGLNGCEDFTGAPKVDLALSGQRQLPGGASDQTHPKPIFQSRDELGHRRSRDANVFGRTREATALRDAHEYSHVGRSAGHIRELLS